MLRSTKLVVMQDEGTAELFINDVMVSPASAHEGSVIAPITFTAGDTLRIQDAGANSVMRLNAIGIGCTSTPAQPYRISSAICSATEYLDTEAQCAAAAASVGAHFGGVTSTAWASGCIFHNSTVYFSPHLVGSSDNQVDAYLCSMSSSVDPSTAINKNDYSSDAAMTANGWTMNVGVSNSDAGLASSCSGGSNWYGYR